MFVIRRLKRNWNFNASLHRKTQCIFTLYKKKSHEKRPTLSNQREKLSHIIRHNWCVFRRSGRDQDLSGRGNNIPAKNQVGSNSGLYTYIIHKAVWARTSRNRVGTGLGSVTVVSYGRLLDCLVQPEMVFQIDLIVCGGRIFNLYRFPNYVLY